MAKSIKTQMELLYEMCVEIYACLELDREWESANPSEASNVADRVLWILDKEDNENFRKLVQIKMDEIDPDFDYHDKQL